MGLTSLLDLRYLIPRVLLWAALFAVALTDGIKHRFVKRRGYQLQRGILASVGLYVVQDVLLLSYSVYSSDGVADGLYKAYIVLTDLADSVFIGLLLLIAAGFCITRDTLGPYKLKVLLIPSIYFATTLAADMIVEVVKGHSADATDINVTDFSAWSWFILNVCQVVSLVALLLAWVYIFDTVQKEVDVLTHPQEGIMGVGPRPDLEAGTGAPGAGEGQGNNVQLPMDGNHVTVGPNANGQAQEIYAQVQGADADEPKTVEDKLAHRAKKTLMLRFSWGVGAYVVATALAILLPLFVYSDPRDEATAVLVVYILQNAVLWAFLGALCFIFRLREDNPYLMLDEEGGEETDFGSPEVRTELGVLTGGGDDDDRGNNSPHSVDLNFSLGHFVLPC